MIAGLLSFGVAYVVGEPSVDAAISLEQLSMNMGAGPAIASEAVPRNLQSTLGLLTATTIIGAVLGGLAGVSTGMAIGRLGRTSPRATALWVAAGGFIVLYFVPFLIYPPNPPGVGEGDTILRRTQLYFFTMALSIVCAGAATLVGTRLRHRMNGWYAALLSIGGYAAAMILATSLLPKLNEVGADYPAQVLYEFRLGSLLTQVALWTLIGVLLAELVQRLEDSSTMPRSPSPAPSTTV